MDVNDLRTVMLVLAFIAFAGIVAWAYSRRRKRDFEEAARLPFTDDEDELDDKIGSSRKHDE